MITARAVRASRLPSASPAATAKSFACSYSHHCRTYSYASRSYYFEISLMIDDFDGHAWFWDDNYSYALRLIFSLHWNARYQMSIMLVSIFKKRCHFSLGHFDTSACQFITCCLHNARHISPLPPLFHSPKLFIHTHVFSLGPLPAKRKHSRTIPG